MKTSYFKFRKKLEQSGKTFFSLADLKKYYLAKKGSMKTLLSSWVGKKYVWHVARGYYAIDLATLDYLNLAVTIDKKSYIGFEYALYYYNLIDQVPSQITLATENRSRTIVARNWVFEYTHLKSDLFFSWEIKENIYIASPEKALADIIYLLARGKRTTDLSTLEKGRIDKKKLAKILKKFPPYVLKKAKELELIKRK